MRLVATLLLTTPFLVACAGDTPQTPEDMILGEWEQSAPISMTQQGQTIIFTDGELEYKKDGTTDGENVMTLQGVPEAMASYKMDVQGTYVIDGDVITDTMSGGTVTPMGDSDEAAQLASQMQAMLTQTPPSKSTIVTLTEDTLVLREMTTGTEITYKRD